MAYVDPNEGRTRLDNRRYLPPWLETAAVDATIAARTAPLSKQVSPGLTITNPRGLRRWHAAIGEALFNITNIVVLGDSISVGVGADGNATGTSGTAYDNITRPRGWVGQLRSRFNVRYGDTGPGWVSSPDNGLRVTLAGGALSATYGPREQGFRVTAATHTATLAITEPFTELDFWTWDGGSGTYSVSVDGAAAQTFSGGSGNINLRTWTKQTITGLADTAHTVVFTGPASGGAYFAGVSARRKSSGVHVHRMAKAGDTTNNVLGLDSVNNANTEAKARSLLGIGVVPVAKLVIVALGVNDHGNQAANDITANAQPGTTPDQYEANLRIIAAQVIAAGACVLLLGEPRRPAGGTFTNSEAEYWVRAKKIALDTDHVAFLDINDVWGSNAQGNELGFYTTSSVHPTLKGHGSMAEIVYTAITQPFGFNAPTS